MWPAHTHLYSQQVEHKRVPTFRQTSTTHEAYANKKMYLALWSGFIFVPGLNKNSRNKSTKSRLNCIYWCWQLIKHHTSFNIFCRLRQQLHMCRYNASHMIAMSVGYREYHKPKNCGVRIISTGGGSLDVYILYNWNKHSVNDVIKVWRRDNTTSNKFCRYFLLATPLLLSG